MTEQNKVYALTMFGIIVAAILGGLLTLIGRGYLR